jgi:type IV pilus assembly protein PilC
MAQHPNAFDALIISLVQSGEASGKLPLIFQHITEMLKWQDELAAQTKNLLLYPLFIAASVTAITFFLMIYLVPQLVGFIQGMGKEVPLQTQILFATSKLFVNYWPAILSMPLIILIIYKSLLRLYPTLHYQTDALKLRLWFIGPVLRKIILARFAHSFALLYGAGINILDSLAHLRNIANNQVIARGLTEVIHDIESGKNLTQSFAQAKIFPPLVLRMLKVGETTGQLDQALLNISYFYDRDVKDTIKRVQVMIEPLMTLILGALLGWVMLSVLSPIYDLISQLKL